jgi:hypothetical protein
MFWATLWATITQTHPVTLPRKVNKTEKAGDSTHSDQFRFIVLAAYVFLCTNS